MCDEEETSITVAQINAGILNYDSTTRMLTPDTRNGVLKVVVSPEEVFSLVWRPRDGGENVHGSTSEFFSLELKPPTKVEVCKIKGQRAVSVRVDGTRKAFFWIQETGDESGDAELIDDINEAIATANEMYIPEAPVEKPPKPQIQQQQQQPPLPTHQGPMSTEEMARLIQMMSSTIPAPKKDLKLDRVLAPGKVIDALLDPKNEAMLNELYQYMPESTRSPEGIRELIRSPQFYRDVKILEAMVKSGEAGPILADFRMNMNAQGPYGGMRKFLEELIRVSKKK